MKRQISFAEVESHGKKRVTRRQRFLDEMESVVPWQRLLAAIEPYYPKGRRGRPIEGATDVGGILRSCVGPTHQNMAEPDRSHPCNACCSSSAAC
ncbi:hypothetical protein BJN34_0095 [Cupriavidus necator]|uniref:Transposase InsH N-terminal domain-containing protein n=1 Tax=Cupriavidus necator TaxID=106590 RepID=A0A2P1DUY7_CUPNE|nr:hypothetical protein BJN34_0095 [Cupriavidus necator]